MLIPADLEQQKIVTTAVYGGTLVAVEGTYDDVNRLASELAGEHEDWAFVNVNVRPYYAEGSKTLGYEVAEQLGWRLPEQVVIPVASGSQLTKVDKAFRELATLGSWRRRRTASSAPRRPAARRWRPRSRPGTTSYVRCDRSTIAKSLAIGNPADGPYVARHRPPHRRRGRGRHATRRSSRASGCWPAPRASSPRRPAA